MDRPFNTVYFLFVDILRERKVANNHLELRLHEILVPDLLGSFLGTHILGEILRVEIPP